MAISQWTRLIVLALVSFGVSAETTNSSTKATDSCCDKLVETLGDAVSHPNSSTYELSIWSYWSTISQVNPACIFTPTTSQDVSLFIQTIRNISKSGTDCKFAVRGGGHSPSSTSNNIQNGITVDMSGFNETKLSDDKKTLSIGPGAKWRNIYTYLNPMGLGVSGARTGSVGVGGLITGGGYSFFSGRYGFVCDSVEEFEVIVGTGEILTVNNASHPDLFLALKGGGNNLGIVTRFDLMTFPQPSVWGGLKVLLPSSLPKLIPALVDFTENMVKDPNGAIITNWLYNSSVKSTLLVNVIAYTANFTGDSPKSFENITSLGPDFLNTLDHKDMVNLTSETEQASGQRDTFVTLTLPNDVDAVQKVVNISTALTQTLKAYKGCTVFAGFEPLPHTVTNHSIARGGNVLGLDRTQDNLIMVLFDLSWSNESDDAAFFNATQSMINQTATYLKSVNKSKDFVYYNYAGSSQNPIAGYGQANVDKLLSVSKSYDPDQIFQKLVPGGFKLSATS